MFFTAIFVEEQNYLKNVVHKKCKEKYGESLLFSGFAIAVYYPRTIEAWAKKSPRIITLKNCAGKELFPSTGKTPEYFISVGLFMQTQNLVKQKLAEKFGTSTLE